MTSYERICAACGELLVPGTPAVFNFQTGEGWHPACPNPMSGINAALDARQAAKQSQR